jgi:hypothetical protein
MSLPPNTADGSGAECPSALVLPELYPARISASSSLLTATVLELQAGSIITGNVVAFSSDFAGYRLHGRVDRTRARPRLIDEGAAREFSSVSPSMTDAWQVIVSACAGEKASVTSVAIKRRLDLESRSPALGLV